MTEPEKITPEMLEAACIQRGRLTMAEDGKSIRGQLVCGMELEAGMGYDFSMTLATMKQELAIDPDLQGQLRTLAVYSLVLDVEGNMPDLLAMQSLVDEDMDVLFTAQQLLKKKRLRSANNTATTD